MTRMTGPDCVVMCNLVNTYTYIHTYIHTYTHIILDNSINLRKLRSRKCTINRAKAGSLKEHPSFPTCGHRMHILKKGSVTERGRRNRGVSRCMDWTKGRRGAAHYTKITHPTYELVCEFQHQPNKPHSNRRRSREVEKPLHDVPLYFFGNIGKG